MPLSSKRAAFIKAALESQGFMQLLGAEVEEVSEGRCVLSLKSRPQLMQHDGLFHGGAIAFLIDNTATAAAGTVAPEDQLVLTAEYKLNLLSPGIGERLLCSAEVVKPGRMLTVVEAKVHVEQEGKAKLIAVALATVANLERKARG